MRIASIPLVDDELNLCPEALSFFHSLSTTLTDQLHWKQCDECYQWFKLPLETVRCIIWP
jgi:hypothetical protein